MSASTEKRWISGTLLVALAYPFIGIMFSFLGSSPNHRLVIASRLGAWLISAAVFVFHLAYEHIRLQSPPKRAAIHAALAVALGAFLLAIWVLVHGSLSPTSHQSRFAVLALVIFPIVTGLPALIAGALITIAFKAIRDRATGARRSG